MNRIKADFAFYIDEPVIEPLLSSRKMYYPLALSMSVSIYLPSTEALYASSRLNSQNFGMNDNIADDPASLLLRT
jgi:hypothetical protein